MSHGRDGTGSVSSPEAFTLVNRRTALHTLAGASARFALPFGFRSQTSSLEPFRIDFGSEAIDDLHRRIAEVLSILRMEHRGQQRVRSLSNGQQKRLAIARAILHSPSLLLLDEPESGLDAEGVELLERLVRQWTADGKSVLMTTHDLERGLDWADRVAVLSKGDIVFDSPKDQFDPSDFRRGYRHTLGVAS